MSRAHQSMMRPFRKSAFAGLGLVVGIALLAVGVLSVFAVHDDGAFEFEGNVVDSPAGGAPDWSSIFVDSNGDGIITNGSGGTPNEIVLPAGGLDAVFLMDDLSAGGLTDDTIFASSNKNGDPKSTWRWDTGNNPPKDDISNVYAYATSAPAGATGPTNPGDFLVYVGMERLAPNGATHIDIELNQDAVGLDKDPPCDADGAEPPTPDDGPPCEFVGSKTIGDILLVINYEQGGALGFVEIREWDGAQWVLVGVFASPAAPLDCSGGPTPPADSVCAATNGTPIAGGSWLSFDRHANVIGGTTSTPLPTNAFAEFGLNLTQIFGEIPCISSIEAKTRSSPSFNSELKDFALGEFNFCGLKSGRKFHDRDADGTDDGGTDPGLSGWTIKLFADDGDGVLEDSDDGATDGNYTALDSRVTDGNGEYIFDDLFLGNYIVCEVISDQTDWFQSHPVSGSGDCSADTTLGPEGHAFGIASGAVHRNNDFGNYQLATKTGRKFHDLDADGSTTGDPGLNGWTIKVFADDGDGVLEDSDDGATDATYTAVASTTTATVSAVVGVYSFDLAPGDYIVCEVLQTEWFQSVPASGSGDCSNDGTLGDEGFAISLLSQDVDSGNDFANYQLATKTGRKFHDLDADGSVTGDPGLNGWTIKVFADDGDGVLEDADDGVADGNYTEVTSDVTANVIVDGVYSFDLEPGDYIVCEVLQADWIQSVPDSGSGDCSNDSTLGAEGYAISLQSQDVDSGNHFANYQLATKSGRKFHDMNADHTDNGGTDPGLNGWTIKVFADDGDGVLEDDDDGSADGNYTEVASTTTATVLAVDGTYSFDLEPGDYIVCEVLQTGWIQSFPVGGSGDCSNDSTLGADGYAISLQSGDVHDDNDFGNTELFRKILITCSEATGDLVVSEVTLDGPFGGTKDTISEPPAFDSVDLDALEDYLCNLGGAQFNNLPRDTYTETDVIPKN